MLFGMQWIQTWGIHEHLLDVATWVSLIKLIMHISKESIYPLSCFLPCKLEVKYFGRMAPFALEPSNTRWTWVSMAQRAQNPGILPEHEKSQCYDLLDILSLLLDIHLFLCFAVKRCWASGAVYVKHCRTELRKHVFWPLIRPGPTRRAVFHLGCNRLRSKSGNRIAVLFLVAAFVCSCFLTLAWPLGRNGCFGLLFPRWGRMSKRFFLRATRTNFCALSVPHRIKSQLPHRISLPKLHPSYKHFHCHPSSMLFSQSYKSPLH